MPAQITKSNIEHCDHWEKIRIITSYISGAFPDRWTSDVPVKKNSLVNDGNIKVIANKFWWKYLRQDKVNLLVYRPDRPYFKQKQKNDTAKLLIFNLLYSAFWRKNK